MKTQRASLAYRVSLLVFVALGIVSLIGTIDHLSGARRLSSVSWDNETSEWGVGVRPWAVHFMVFLDPADAHPPVWYNPIGYVVPGKVQRWEIDVPLVLTMARMLMPEAAGAPQIGLLSIGIWPIMGAAAILPAIRLGKGLKRRWIYRAAHRARRWRLGLGKCSICGYDLRESHGQCPECGRAIRWVPVTLGRRSH